MKPQQKVFAKIWLGSLSVALGSAPALAQRTPSEWNAPFPAHRIIDNVYFVGTQLLGTFLVTTPEGHILINSDFESTVPVIRDSVESLGFDFEDIDHHPRQPCPRPGVQSTAPGRRAGRTRRHGTANRTPGHTRGCQLGARSPGAGPGVQRADRLQLRVNDNYVLVDNPELPVDVFLGSHGFWYGLDEKYEQLRNRAPGDPNPFVSGTSRRCWRVSRSPTTGQPSEDKGAELWFGGAG